MATMTKRPSSAMSQRCSLALAVKIPPSGKSASRPVTRNDGVACTVAAIIMAPPGLT